MTKPGDWMENKQTIADLGHALGGYGVLITVSLFTRAWLPILIVEVLLATYVLGKEFWYDLRYESGETLASSTEDALGYLAGNAVAWLPVLLAWHFA